MSKTITPGQKTPTGPLRDKHGNLINPPKTKVIDLRERP